MPIIGPEQALQLEEFTFTEEWWQRSILEKKKHFSTLLSGLAAFYYARKRLNKGGPNQRFSN